MYRRFSRRSAATVGVAISAMPLPFIGRAREETRVSGIPRQLDEIARRDLAGREPVLDLDRQGPRRAQRHRVPGRIARVDDLVDDALAAIQLQAGGSCGTIFSGRTAATARWPTCRGSR